MINSFKNVDPSMPGPATMHITTESSLIHNLGESISEVGSFCELSLSTSKIRNKELKNEQYTFAFIKKN